MPDEEFLIASACCILVLFVVVSEIFPPVTVPKTLRVPVPRLSIALPNAAVPPVTLPFIVGLESFATSKQTVAPTCTFAFIVILLETTNLPPAVALFSAIFEILAQVILVSIVTV